VSDKTNFILEGYNQSVSTPATQLKYRQVDE